MPYAHARSARAYACAALAYARITSVVALATLASVPEVAHAQTPDAPRTITLEVLTDDILLLRVDEGYVVHHGPGQPPSADEIFVEPLDGAAAQAATYAIASPDDRAYATPQAPTRVDRKSKPTDFADYCDGFGDDPSGRFPKTCFNSRPDQATEHLLYLRLPSPLLDGATYEVSAAVPGVPPQRITYQADVTRSEAVHVNQVGYVPAAAEKFGYVYHWLGDGGGLVVDAPPGAGPPPPPRPFRLVDVNTGAAAFEGTLRFRKTADNRETFWVQQAPPSGNFLQAPAWEADFSSFGTPGRYRLCVEGVGCSFPFDIGDEVYRTPFDAVVEGLYQHRSGVATVAPYTSQPRPAPHRVGVTPGFAGRLKYSTVRAMDYDDFDAPTGQKGAIDAAVLGPLESWGWYQDAGDWDAYYSHTNIPAHLLWLYEMQAGVWRDGQLNLPEAGNGLPDVLDQALWQLRWQHRLRTELLDKGYGSGGVGGGRVFGDLWGEDRGPGRALRGSWEDTDRDWIVSGEDPMVTYKYAGLAAHTAVLLAASGLPDPEGVDWATEATEAYAWAEANTLAGDDTKVVNRLPFYHARYFAAANLYRLTGEARYETQASTDFDRVTVEEDNRSIERFFGTAAYRAAADERPGSDPAVVAKVTAQLFKDGRDFLQVYRDERAARWGGNWFLPIVNGQATTPLVQPGVLAHYFAPRHDPGNADAYAAALYSTADYFLGNNPLNLTWVTGVGERSPAEVFALDAWVLAGETPRPGIVPYGPTAQAFNRFPNNGPFNYAWPLQYIYPADEDAWPAHELWFDQRPSPTTAEYTVHQNLAPAIFTYGYLYALTAAPSVPVPVTWVSAAAERTDAGAVEVTWRVAAASDNDRYEVRRRNTDGAWATIATVPDAARADYAWVDATAPAEPAYYRVRQVDLSGATSDSPLLYAPSLGNAAAWTIAPTAARAELRLLNAPAAPVEVFDATGRRVGRYPAGTAVVPVATLPAGAYYVRVGTQTRRFHRLE